MLVWASAPAAVAPLSHSRQTRKRERQAGADISHGELWWLAHGKGVTELRTRQDVLLPMLPAQEILP